MKTCTRCNESKAPDQFNPRGENNGKLRSHCRTCVRLHYRNTYKSIAVPLLTPEERKERRRASSKKCMSRPVAKSRNAARQAARRAKKQAAQPTWLTANQIAHIASHYAFASQVKREFGDILHVDHIIPLNGKDVCGLHVPWNLQILEKTENIRKGNRYED